MTGYVMPQGAVIVEKAGMRKMRQAQARIRREEAERLAPMRAAANLIRDQDTRRRFLVDRLAAAEHAVSITKGSIVDVKARLDELRKVDLPDVERAVVAAREALANLDGDVERAQAIMDAQAVLERNP